MSNLNFYQRNKIERFKIHRCPHCSYTTTNPKLVLQNHIYSKHTKECDKPFHCYVCEKGFAQKNNMIIHLKKNHNIEHVFHDDHVIVEYHIYLTNKIPKRDVVKKRLMFYKKNPIMNFSLNDYNVEYSVNKKFKKSFIHYDSNKGYIRFMSFTEKDIKNNKNKRYNLNIIKKI